MKVNKLKSPLKWALLSVFLLIIGCQNTEKDFKIDKYIDLEKIIDHQIKYYQENPPETFTKSILFEDKQEKKKQPIKNLDALKKIIETATINKPGYRGVYKIRKNFETQGQDTLFSIIRNDLKKDEKAFVQSIYAYYNGAPRMENLYRILIFKKRDNFLYKNSQLIQLMFKNGIMRKLSMHGKQSILFFQPKMFGINFRIE